MNVFRIVSARSAKQSGIIGGKRPFDPNIIFIETQGDGVLDIYEARCFY